MCTTLHRLGCIGLHRACYCAGFLESMRSLPPTSWPTVRALQGGSEAAALLLPTCPPSCLPLRRQPSTAARLPVSRASLTLALVPALAVSPPATKLCTRRPGSAATSACSPISRTRIWHRRSRAPDLQGRGFHFSVMPRQWHWRSPLQQRRPRPTPAHSISQVGHHRSGKAEVHLKSSSLSEIAATTRCTAVGSPAAGRLPPTPAVTRRRPGFAWQRQPAGWPRNCCCRIGAAGILLGRCHRWPGLLRRPGLRCVLLHCRRR